MDREKVTAAVIADDSKQSRWMPASAGMTSLLGMETLGVQESLLRAELRALAT